MQRLNRWVYAVNGVILLLVAGLVYAWSVLSSPIAAEFPLWSKAQLSLTFTITMTMFCVGCLVGGFLSKKLSPRVYAWSSAVLFLVGFWLAGRISTPMGLYLSFGVLCGFASGFVYNAVMGSVGLWFPDKQGLISGLLLMGFGLSSFLVGKVYQALTPTQIGGWRTSFMVIGVVSCVVLALCSFFLVKPPADFRPPAPAKVKKSAVNPVAMEATTGVMLRKGAFWLYYLWAILLSAAGLALVSQASGVALQVGAQMDPGAIATVVGLISIFNGAGRVIIGGVFDKAGRSITMQTANLVFIVAGVTLAAAIMTESFPILVAGFIIGGLAYGGVTPTNSAFVSSYFGIKNYPLNFSVINTNLIIASFGSTIAGSLYDSSKTYISMVVMILVLSVLGILASLGISLCDRRTLARKK